MLSKNWIIENNTDPEYKSYQLLAYLQEVFNSFELRKLYPHLADLVDHHRNLKALRDGTAGLESVFPKALSGINPADQTLDFQATIRREDMMEDLMVIIDQSLPLIEQHLNAGTQLYEAIEKELHISVVGILPMHIEEGYILVNNGNEPQTRVFNYNITVIEHFKEKFRGIRTGLVGTYKRSISNSMGSIKLDLVRSNPSLPNPVALAVETELTYPMTETLLPILKRSVVRFLSSVS
jgi:hypothetical protein